MGLFKKKEVKGSRLPELPSAPSFPELPSEESRFPSLPQLKPLPQLPPLPSITPPEAHFLRPAVMEISEERRAMKEGPVFVKIDKFKDAIANFELVKKKLQESSSLLEKIKETRAKEEEELNSWSAELNTLKEKIAAIDRKIFSSLE